MKSETQGGGTTYGEFEKTAKGDCLLHHVCPSVRTHGKIALSLDEFN